MRTRFVRVGGYTGGPQEETKTVAVITGGQKETSGATWVSMEGIGRFFQVLREN